MGGWRKRRRDDDKINEEIEDEKTSINSPASIYSPLFCSASNYDSTYTLVAQEFCVACEGVKAERNTWFCLNEKSMRFMWKLISTIFSPDNRNYNILINNYNSVSYVPGWVLGVQLGN